MALTRRIARPLLASSFIIGSAQVLKDPRAAAEGLRHYTDKLVPMAQSRGLPLPNDPATLARLAAAVQLSAAGALAMGKAPRISAAVLTATLVPSVVTNNPLKSDADAATKSRNVAETAKQASLVGGLILATVDTEGRPGLAWRARRATADAKRQARHLAKEAKLETRLAAKSLS